MKIEIASRVGQIAPSLTLEIAARARAMKEAGLDICSFSAGEPDFDTPEHIKAAAVRALESGKTKYGPVAGEPELRAAIASKLQRDNDLAYTPEQVIVTNGGKFSLYSLFQVLLEPGDEAIVPAPYWLSYPEMIGLAGGSPIVVPTTAASGYKLSPEQLRAAISPRTKLVIINSPANPTGSVYSPAELEALAEVIVSANILAISDEIYENIIYDGAQHVSLGSLGPEIFARTILSNGFAKSYAMTGWRVGYVAAPPEVIRAMAALQSHSTSNVCTFAQYGAIAALTEPSTRTVEMYRAFAARRTRVLNRLAAIPNLSCPVPMGAFYAFVNFSRTGYGSSTQFCRDLLETARVAVVPGIAFGADDCFRLSYATDLATLDEGLLRLQRFVSEAAAAA